MSIEDLGFAMRVLDREPGAAEEFSARFRDEILAHVFSRCVQPRDRDEAVFIVDGLIAKCCVERFLEKYLGSGSLEGWLKTVAANELKKHWERRRRDPVANAIEWVDSTEGSLESDSEELRADSPVDAAEFHGKFMEATVRAFSRLREEFPDSLAILRLSMLHGVSQRDLARAFAVHESEISKKKKRGIDFLKSEVNHHLATSFPRGSFTWSDLRDFARHSDEIVHDEDLADRLLGSFGLR